MASGTSTRPVTALAAAVLWAVLLFAARAVALAGRSSLDSPSPSAAELVSRILQSDPWGLGDGEVVARATVRDKAGRTRELAFTARSRRYEDQLTKSLVRFTSPPDLAGVGFLQIQKRDGDDDRWLYLPELKRSRRIAGMTRRSAFMGTDFSYADLDRRDLRRSVPTLMADQRVGDVPCWRVAAIPEAQDSAYGRLEIWVRQDNFIPVKWLMYARSGVLLKTLLATETRQVDGRWFITRSVMTNHTDGRDTELVLDRMSPAIRVRDDEFTLRSLEKASGVLMRPAAMILASATAFAVPAAPDLLPQAGSGAGREQTRGTEAKSPPAIIQFGGWSRASVEAMPPSAGDREGHAAQLDVPHNEIVARGLLNLRARYSRGRSFEAQGAVLLTYDLFKPDSSPTERDAASRADAHAEVREAYVGFFATTFDVRVGVQRIAWGHADTFSPNDVVNANDLSDPILNETELVHRSTFSVRADLERAFGTFQLVARPFLQPDRYDVHGSNWAFVQPDAPAGYRGALGVLSRQSDVSRMDAGRTLLVDAARPKGFAGFQGGLRFDWRVGAFDVTHYYDYGYHGTPEFRIDRATVALLNAIDWVSASPAQVLTRLSGAGDAIGSRWARRHHIGLDVGTTKGPFALRVDAAYQQPALFYDRTLNGWLSPAVQAVFGAEFQTGDLGRAILVEGRYRHIQRKPPVGGLLFAEQDSVEAALLLRWTWMDRFEFEARGVAGRGPTSYVFRPQIAWKRDGRALRLGLLLLGGEEGSFGDWYRRNRSVYLMFRRAF